MTCSGALAATTAWGWWCAIRAARLGANNLLLAAVTAFYDRQRARGEEFFIYPDYFLFPVDRPLGDHSMLDVFPSHKDVVVPDDPEAIVERSTTVP